MSGELAAGHERTVREIRYAAGLGLDGACLLGRVAELLRGAVPFQAYCASTTDPATHLITHGLAAGFDPASAGCEDAGTVFLERVYFEEELGQLATMLDRHRSVWLLSEGAGRDLSRSLRYRELLRPNGFGHELSVAFQDRGMWGGMDLIRCAGDRDFAPHEMTLLRRVAPAIGAGLKYAALRREATIGTGGSEAPGVLALDPGGRLSFCTPTARRWLDDLGGFSRATSRDQLPIAVRMVVTALERSLSPRSETDAHLVPRISARTASGRWLTLHASRGEAIQHGTAPTVVVVAPAVGQEVTGLRMSAYGLSVRETEVVGLVAQGLATRQIATALHLSEHTVQRHVQNTFDKVGVRSRRQLVKTVYLGSLPGSTGPEPPVAHALTAATPTGERP